MVQVGHISPAPIPRYHEKIQVVHYNGRFAEDVARHLERNSLLGVSTAHSEKGKLTHLVLATETQVVSIIPDGTPLGSRFKNLVLGKSTTLTSIDMDRVALRIYDCFSAHVVGVNLSTLAKDERELPSQLVSGKLGTMSRNHCFQVNRLWHRVSSEEDALKRAWISVMSVTVVYPELAYSPRIVRLAQRLADEIGNARRVDTRNVKQKFLPILCRMVSISDLLADSRPKSTVGSVDAFKQANGGIDLVNSRYKSRIKRSSQSIIALKGTDNDKVFYGYTHKTKGRTTNLRMSSSGFQGLGDLASIEVIGVNDPTNPEKACDDLILRILMGECDVWQAEFVQRLWLPSRSDGKSVAYPSSISSTDPVLQELNTSQKEVVMKMTSDAPLAIIQGPPGTGKTTTISAAAKVWERRRQSAWIVAHSNVAVKNIAEKLFKERISFKIIVSKEFHFEWHEHLYEEIVHNLIRTDELPLTMEALERLLEDSAIILSTLSSLSNPALDQCRAFDLVPFEILVVDEASQINVFEYMAVFQKFRRTLKQAFFFGDPKQLPPFGKESVSALQCIFDIQRLNTLSHFLDIQYRMPVPLGRFISNHVYNGRLKSEHGITNPSSVVFVDVSNGSEEKKGTSWVNEGEINTIVRLVKDYYLNADFCVITPYDPQRAAIERALKSNSLPWENAVFNVDSFQGNERKYVLISVVRTKQPGFLRSEERLNVMLTRCQAGAVIVTNKGFLATNGRDTLLGKMAQFWIRNYSSQRTWVDWKQVSDQTVNLPGAPGKNASAAATGVVGAQQRRTGPVPHSVNFSHPPPRSGVDASRYRADFPMLPAGNVPKPRVRGSWARLAGAPAYASSAPSRSNLHWRPATQSAPTHTNPGAARSVPQTPPVLQPRINDNNNRKPEGVQAGNVNGSTKRRKKKKRSKKRNDAATS